MDSNVNKLGLYKKKLFEKSKTKTKVSTHIPKFSLIMLGYITITLKTYLGCTIYIQKLIFLLYLYRFERYYHYYDNDYYVFAIISCQS